MSIVVVREINRSLGFSGPKRSLGMTFFLELGIYGGRAGVKMCQIISFLWQPAAALYNHISDGVVVRSACIY